MRYYRRSRGIMYWWQPSSHRSFRRAITGSFNGRGNACALPSDAGSSGVSCCTIGGISQSIPDPRQPHREVGRASGERLLPMVL